MRINRAISFFKEHSLIDLLRKLFFFFTKRRQYVGRRILNAYRFKNWDLVTGRNISVQGQIYNIKIGANTSIYDNCIFEFSAKGKVLIGSHVILSYGVLIACSQSVTVGNDVQIGEYTSIRDSTHQYKLDERSMKYMPDIVAPISIGNNVWIGRGCLIQPGTVIEDGVVVAANSVVKGRLLCNGIYGGTPAKLIKYRE
ncbi:MAG: acyltransferase [Bacteroidetes bacterium]|nr:acyltransferase [Bacteroidota bacterium]